MPDLIAIAYDDTTTALTAMDEVHHLAEDLVIQPDAVAAIIRAGDGSYRTVTNQHEIGAGATWGLFWGMLFGILFFVPVLGMAVGAGLGAIMGRIAKSSIDRGFQDQVKDALRPGTSALFLIVEEMTGERATSGLARFGGTVVKTSLSDDDEAALQAALHGAAPDERS